MGLMAEAALKPTSNGDPKQQASENCAGMRISALATIRPDGQEFSRVQGHLNISGLLGLLKVMMKH